MSGAPVEHAITRAIGRLVRSEQNDRLRDAPFQLFAAELFNNLEKFELLRTLLDDENSKRTLDWVVQFRLLSFLTNSRERGTDLAGPLITEAAWHSYIDTANSLDEISYEKNLDIDVVENFVLDGYNYPDFCSVAESDTVLDFGAFNGNSSVALARHCTNGVVYAFEPNPFLWDSLNNNISRSGSKNIEVIQSGVGSQSGQIGFKRDGAASRIDPKGDLKVDIVVPDQWVQERQLSKVDFLKFDIEGYEQNALQGCQDIIKRYRPKIAISVYHLFNDLTVLPFRIRELSEWYRFRLRHNARTGGEIVLYCAPISY